jgi:hypothetical protein
MHNLGRTAGVRKNFLHCSINKPPLPSVQSRRRPLTNMGPGLAQR